MTSGSNAREARGSTLSRMLSATLGDEATSFALSTLEIDAALGGTGDTVSRAQLAMGLNAALFVNLLGRVRSADNYVARVRARGEQIVFDHGALRTIDGDTGALPVGYASFARFLEPLGYKVGGIYPLPKLNMTGRAFVHRDMPECIPQFFVSELHISHLDPEAQKASARIFSTSADPLTETDQAALNSLVRDGSLSIAAAADLLKSLVSCFDRQHQPPKLEDYEILLRHSPEGGWIATEGNAFNHATTRVPNVIELAEVLKSEGAPIKPAVEISQNRRVRQTAFIADKVQRVFLMPDGEEIVREVPGSFYEFISRDIDPETGKLDLTFDSGNATGIFAVTRGQ